ncbi:hypothetical protein [Marinicauda pacifica]|jgi:hypothetical protein|uniref:hypothetical protein n=1 Tax=Marinicauda pacifica TaxID=1133559 RepID=UPI0035C834D4
MLVVVLEDCRTPGMLVNGICELVSMCPEVKPYGVMIASGPRLCSKSCAEPPLQDDTGAALVSAGVERLAFVCEQGLQSMDALGKTFVAVGGAYASFHDAREATEWLRLKERSGPGAAPEDAPDLIDWLDVKRRARG